MLHVSALAVGHNQTIPYIKTYVHREVLLFAWTQIYMKSFFFDSVANEDETDKRVLKK
jgi:hypothetical protein